MKLTPLFDEKWLETAMKHKSEGARLIVRPRDLVIPMEFVDDNTGQKFVLFSPEGEAGPTHERVWTPLVGEIPPVFSVRDIAGFLGYSIPAIKYHLYSENVPTPLRLRPAHTIGRALIFTHGDIQSWLRARLGDDNVGHRAAVDTLQHMIISGYAPISALVDRLGKLTDISDDYDREDLSAMALLNLNKFMEIVAEYADLDTLIDIIQELLALPVPEGETANV